MLHGLRLQADLASQLDKERLEARLAEAAAGKQRLEEQLASANQVSCYTNTDIQESLQLVSSLPLDLACLAKAVVGHFYCCAPGTSCGN